MLTTKQFLRQWTKLVPRTTATQWNDLEVFEQVDADT